MSDSFLATRRVGWSQRLATDSSSIPVLLDLQIAMNVNGPPGTFENRCSTGNKSATSTFLDFMPLGTSDNSPGDTLDIRLVGWDRNYANTVWVPTTLGRVTATLASVGLSEGTDAGCYTCNTIAITEGTDGVTITQQSNASGFATFRIDACGCEYVSTDVSVSGGGTGLIAYIKAV